MVSARIVVDSESKSMQSSPAIYCDFLGRFYNSVYTLCVALKAHFRYSWLSNTIMRKKKFLKSIFTFNFFLWQKSGEAAYTNNGIDHFANFSFIFLTRNTNACFCRYLTTVQLSQSYSLTYSLHKNFYFILEQNCHPVSTFFCTVLFAKRVSIIQQQQ